MTGLPVAFRTLGCKVNRVESNDIAAQLAVSGVEIVDEDQAAVVVVNTCTVTAEADAKARKAVRQALKGARRPVVVVTGCLAALDAPALTALDERVVVEPDKALVAHRVAEALGISEAVHGVSPFVSAGFEGDRTRAVLKVEDGCDNSCSYCIIPHARGVPRGVELAQCVERARAVVERGTHELVLTGINLGRYRDPETGADLADLVRAIADTGIARIRLSSIEPPDLTQRLLRTLANSPAVCEHLHVPLQSGSDAVLSAMNRAYDTARYARWIEDARAAIPGLAVTTDVIAGFPGETDEHHRQTLAFVEACGFSRLHVFRYSVRPGTPAAAMEQVAPQVRAQRAAELRELGDRLASSFAASREGTTVEVLVERIDGDTASGTSREYLRTALPAQGLAVGDLAHTVLNLLQDDPAS